jgi:hypothetical protein
MIQVTVFVDSDKNQFTGFHTYGHAEYADAGYDIICSAVSAIVITTINSIEQLTGDSITYSQNQENGEIDVCFDVPISSEATLLVQSMLLGLSGIQQEYGEQYLKVNTKEV